VTYDGNWRETFRPDIPTPARIYDYLLGGKDNYPADRAVAEAMIVQLPNVRQAVQLNRAFLRRVVRYLVGEAGIRQIIDIGAGLPTAGNTHEVAQSVDPTCRVVYVDNDPVVLAHARALLRSRPEGVTSYIDADAREPGKIIASAQETLDFDQPVAIVMIHILNYIEGPAEVAGILRTLTGALPTGGYVAIMHPAADKGLAAVQQRWNQLAPIPLWLRDRAEVASWLTGLELVEPEIVEVDKWRPADSDPVYPNGMPIYGVVARKP